MYLSEKTKQIISEGIGIRYIDLIRMDDDEITAIVETKIGRKIKWKSGAMVDGLPIVTSDEIDRRIDEFIKKTSKGFDR